MRILYLLFLGLFFSKLSFLLYPYIVGILFINTIYCDINNIIDRFDVASGNSLTLSYSQFNGHTGINTGTLTLSDSSLTGAQIKSVNDASTNAINLTNVTTISSSTMAQMLEVVQNTGAVKRI